MGWIGVDLDGTLAKYDKWDGSIGEPIPLMAERVKKWLAEGKDVRLFTIRADLGPEQVTLVKAWCLTHLGQELPLTATKDAAMLELWDDRAISVEMNTGVNLKELGEMYQDLL